MHFMHEISSNYFILELHGFQHGLCTLIFYVFYYVWQIGLVHQCMLILLNRRLQWGMGARCYLGSSTCIPEAIIPG
jgi:hypothetical protein